MEETETHQIPTEMVQSCVWATDEIADSKSQSQETPSNSHLSKYACKVKCRTLLCVRIGSSQLVAACHMAEQLFKCVFERWKLNASLIDFLV